MIKKGLKMAVYEPNKRATTAYNTVGAPLMQEEDEFAFEDNLSYDAYGNPSYSDIGSIAQSAAEQSINPKLLDMSVTSAYFKSQALKERQDDLDAERNLYSTTSTIGGFIPKKLSRDDDKALRTLGAYKTDTGLAQYPNMESVLMNPARTDQTAFERFLKPGTTEQYYTPKQSGVFNKSGKLIADSEVGFGKKWGSQGKLSNVKLNPETGNYEKKFSGSKALTALGVLAASGSELSKGGLFGKKGDKRQSTTRYATALAPLLAATPYGWAGAAALQTGMALYDRFLKDTKYDKNLKEMRWDKPKSWKLSKLWGK
jgi:hypothetical protein